MHQLLTNYSAAVGSKGGRIFINENLTISRRKVLMKANQMRKDGLLVSCWTLDGKICIKTSPDGNPVRIYAEDDLKNILSNSSFLRLLNNSLPSIFLN